MVLLLVLVVNPQVRHLGHEALPHDHRPVCLTLPPTLLVMRVSWGDDSRTAERK